jgi:biotin-dependent carboxylase-like uncharacterized protein
MSARALEVVAPGTLTLVQDLGRTGWSAVGVGPSGAFDRAALRLANRLVGNAEGAPALESLGGGLALRALERLVVAVTGADGLLAVTATGGRRTVARRSPLHLRAGDVLSLDHPPAGIRSYVAVRRGVAVGLVLGSASYDTLSRLGPPPLAAGDVLATGAADVGDPHVDHAPERRRPRALRVVPGPRDDWFDGDAVAALVSSSWTVRSDSDRVGVRLDGPPLRRRDARRELPSEPMVTGALQVPPDGRPVLLGPDRPTTGGYPVVAVVVDDDLDAVAQLRPGDAVSFAVVR